MGLHTQGMVFLWKSIIPFFGSCYALCVVCVWCADDEMVRTTEISTSRGPIPGVWKMF